MLTPYLLIGEVLRPQGIRGEVKVRPYAADPSRFREWDTLYLKDGEAYSPIEARCSRVHDGFAYITLGDCADPESAERLRGRELYIAREQAGETAEDEVLVADLIGCRAVDENGTAVGTLTDVLQNSSVDVYVFRTPRGTMMAPALLTAFPEVDVENRLIRVDSRRLQEVCVYED